ncbi:MAG: hypothetical protein MUC89_24075 [Acetobacteraceae bacterium]|jgi:hypothetical protein|nr:hypothetical protein [Acetobacteraceae bacterium]
MSKTLLKPRPSPEEAIAVVQQAAAHLPRVVTAPEPTPAAAPLVSAAAPEAERAEILNLRLRPSTIREIVRLADERGMTMKQVVTHALRDFGAQVAPRDLEDHTSRRRGSSG